MNRIFMFAAIGFLVLVGVILVAKSVAEREIFGRMTPDMKANFEVWYKEKVDLPPDAIDVQPFSPEIAAAASDFMAEWNQNSEAAIELAGKLDANFKSGETLDLNSADIQAQFQQLDSFELLMEKFESLVNCPGYEIEALTAGIVPDEKNIGLVPNFLTFQVTVKLLRLRAFEEFSEGRPADALNTAHTILRASSASPYSSLISRLVAIACGSIGARTWHDLVTRVDDPALLRETLAAQSSLSPLPQMIGDSDDLGTMDIIGSLRAMKRAGVDVNFANMTSRELLGEHIRALKVYNRDHVLPNIKDEAARERFTQNNSVAGNLAESMFYSGKSPLIPRFVDRLGAATIYMISVPNFTEAQTRDKTHRSKFEILRVETARRLAALESGVSPSDLAALTPLYIPEVPLDYFAPLDEAGPATLTTARSGVVYSRGPDEIDDKAGLAYDPTNGTLSRGDIFFARAN